MKRFIDLSSGRTLVGGLGLIMVAMVAVGAGYATRGFESSSLAVAPPPPAVESIRGVVQSAAADSITVLTEAGPVTVKVSSSTPREAVQRIALADIKVGDWVNAGGVPHSQTIYALTALVVIPASNLEAGR